MNTYCCCKHERCCCKSEKFQDCHFEPRYLRFEALEEVFVGAVNVVSKKIGSRVLEFLLVIALLIGLSYHSEMSVIQGHGSQPCVIIKDASGASIEVYLLGATLFSWKTASGTDVLFQSSKAIFDGEKPIRAGIPIVFPQFAMQGPLPMHGFARTSVWNFVSSHEGFAQFELVDNERTRAIWDHEFKLTYTIQFTSTTLTTKLSVINPKTATKSFAFEALLHTYISTGKDSIDSLALEGLHNVTFVDKPDGMKEKVLEDETMKFSGEVDRIFMNTPNDVVLKHVTNGGNEFSAIQVKRHAVVRDCEPNLKQVLVHAPLDVVVWNPGAVRAAAIADLGDEDYKHYVCIEPGRVSRATADFQLHREFPPGKEWILTQELTLLK
jgi:glucose-6-phosphate 1-epimerase